MLKCERTQNSLVLCLENTLGFRIKQPELLFYYSWKTTESGLVGFELHYTIFLFYFKDPDSDKIAITDIIHDQTYLF